MLTLSYSCFLFKLARPPKKRELPRTSRRLDRMDPTKEHFTTSILPWCNANRAMISSVTFPQVAFSSPPTRGATIQFEMSMLLLKLHVETKYRRFALTSRASVECDLSACDGQIHPIGQKDTTDLLWMNHERDEASWGGVSLLCEEADTLSKRGEPEQAQCKQPWLFQSIKKEEKS